MPPGAFFCNRSAADCLEITGNRETNATAEGAETRRPTRRSRLCGQFVDFRRRGQAYNVLMRRLLRVFRATATLISLVLAISIILLWIRSYFFQDAITRITHNRPTLTSTFAAVYTERGRFKFSLCRRTFDAQEGFDTFDGFLMPPPSPSWPQGWSYRAAPFVNAGPFFQIESRNWTPTPLYYSAGRYSYRWVALPLWLFLLIFLIPPLRWVVSRVHRRRTENLCPECCYDLRASPDRCPECGAPRQAKAVGTV